MTTVLRLVQFADQGGKRRVGVPDDSGAQLALVDGAERVYDLALEAVRAGKTLEAVVRPRTGRETADYGRIVAEKRLLPPLDHPDPARCLVSLTGLTHLGSAASRDKMHATQAADETDSIRMFKIGLAGGKPKPGKIGAQPEWAYKGDGRCVVAPEAPLTQPGYADDGGEEAEIAGLYVIADDGTPRRVGFALGNEFADHVLEKKNYLYLAHSKVRECSFGPELLVGELPASVEGTVTIRRGTETVWSSPFASGEAHMSHSIANLEHHQFKYAAFRRPGDVHVHFFGANGVSFGAGVRCREGDVFEISVPLFGRPLRNPLRMEKPSGLVTVKPL